MRITNTYRKHAGVPALVLSVLLLAMWIGLGVGAHVWSFGLLIVTIVTMVISFIVIGTRMESKLDRLLLSDNVIKVERKFFGLTYNGKQLKHYNKVRLTHAPEPYADEKKRTLWLHPTHFSVDKNALAAWQENGGIISEEG